MKMKFTVVAVLCLTAGLNLPIRAQSFSVSVYLSDDTDGTNVWATGTTQYSPPSPCTGMCTGAQHNYTGQVTISGQGSNSCTFEDSEASNVAVNLSCEAEVLNGGDGSYDISFEASANCTMIGNFLNANPADVTVLHHSGYYGPGWTLSASLPTMGYWQYSITVNPYGSSCPGPSSQSNVVFTRNYFLTTDPGAPSTNYAQCSDAYTQSTGWKYRINCAWQFGGGGLYCD